MRREEGGYHMVILNKPLHKGNPFINSLITKSINKVSLRINGKEGLFKFVKKLDEER